MPLKEKGVLHEFLHQQAKNDIWLFAIINQLHELVMTGLILYFVASFHNFTRAKFKLTTKIILEKYRLSDTVCIVHEIRVSSVLTYISVTFRVFNGFATRFHRWTKHALETPFK